MVENGVGGEEMLHSATFLRIVSDIRKILLETKKNTALWVNRTARTKQYSLLFAVWLNNVAIL